MKRLLEQIDSVPRTFAMGLATSIDDLVSSVKLLVMGRRICLDVALMKLV